MTTIHRGLPSFLTTLPYTFNYQSSLVQKQRMYYCSHFMTGKSRSENLNSLPKATQVVRTYSRSLLIPYFPTRLCCRVEHHMPFRKRTIHADWQSSASMRICGLCQLLEYGLLTLSDHPALPITRFTISQSAQ